MAPRKLQNIASSTPAKILKATVSSQKKSTSMSAHHGISKKAIQSRRSGFQAGQDSEFEAIVSVSNRENSVQSKKPTSFAARQKERPRMKLSELMAESTRKDDSPEDYSTTFGTGSTALYTWGKAASEPVSAVGSLRRHKGFKLFGVRRGRNSAFAKLTFGLNRDEGTTTPFRILDLPLEIRWRVYSFLLIHPKAVLVYPDWQMVHVNSPQDHTILRANKQIFLESCQFLYEKNIFHAVINSKPLGIEPELNLMTRFIKSQFLLFLKNVILECRFNPYVKGPEDKLGATAKCLKTLVTSGASLDSVTLAVSSTGPYVKVVPTVMLPGAAPFPTFQPRQTPLVKTIPEFFKVPGSKIMRVIPTLRCKVLNIITRTTDSNRILVSINLRDLPVNQVKGGWFDREKTARQSARRRASVVKADLVGLQKRLEDIFEDYQRAILEGKARLLTEDEGLADGIRLANPMMGQEM